MNFNHYRNKIIKDTVRLIKIPSIYDENTITNTQPFGASIDECLDETLMICKELGFNTYKDEKGYYGYAEVGSGEEYIAILCHLDVVPEGDLIKWMHPPFEGKEIDGVIYGRGATDDKGPTVCAIYTVKALLDQQVHFKKRIRLIFGLDEETLWRGMNEYVQKETPPICSIAPDGVFPFVYAEKGLLQLELSRCTKPNDLIINGGKNYNSVAMDAYYSGNLKNTIVSKIKDEMDYIVDGDTLKIIGIPAHASTPHIGKNAVLYLAKILKSIGKDNDIINILTTIFNVDYKNTNLFNEIIKDESGEITVNLGAIEMNKEITKIKMDLRIPVTYKKEEILKQIEDTFSPFGFKINIFSYLEPLHVPLDSEFSKILLDTYKNHTHDDTHPITMGGGTYARVFRKNTACFGPRPIGVNTKGHEPNEFINVDDLIKALEIYYDTLLRLNNCDTLNN